MAFKAGQAAGACGFSARNGIASFFGDATLTAHRRAGVHSAMIAERLRLAIEGGCELATAGTQPGSTSQRNYQRLGFEVAYTRLTMISG
jgi:GNAT superfamily N-acetyltransferase